MRNRVIFKAIKLFALICILAPCPANSQPTRKSPADVISFLTFESDRPGKELVMAGIGGCSGMSEDRAAARSLVEFGQSAVPDLERALDSMERDRGQSKYFINFNWLVLAYAKIKGPAAFPRLREMADNKDLRFIQSDIDDAIALSLGLTSYIHSSLPVISTSFCRGSDDPKDVLNQLILAWVKNDRQWFDAGLGPIASASLDQYLKGQEWDSWRARRWHAKPGDVTAIGYRFDTPGQWAEPEETLERGRSPHLTVLQTATVYELNALFRNRSGGDCGAHRVRFLALPTGPRGLRVEYRIDNSDLEELLQSISACVEATSGMP